ncbi:hypothetical protein AMECASPLE_038606 [Ameca splendens]|uniref:Uncharacterized protein n=1 Tax=Ameca splendens TaxID=208324 RepID=A0ABV0Y8X2_9TELE
MEHISCSGPPVIHSNPASLPVTHIQGSDAMDTLLKAHGFLHLFLFHRKDLKGLYKHLGRNAGSEAACLSLQWLPQFASESDGTRGPTDSCPGEGRMHSVPLRLPG